MKALILVPMIFLASMSLADTGIDAVFVGSSDLGYEDSGFGLQFDSDGRVGDWGYDVQLTALANKYFEFVDGHGFVFIRNTTPQDYAESYAQSLLDDAVARRKAAAEAVAPIESE